ncbi:MAG: PEP-CTERM sorting domain-containing protein, partial [Thermoguttaceae bacterium]|nr:PEP-CTERM sorting domain-containing protein [Thermoguttaceae bacterium]
GGTGSVIFDGTASYTVDPSKLGSTLGSVQVGQNSTLILAGEISSDVSKNITVANASNPLQVSGSTINVTLSEESTEAPSLTFENDLNFTGDNTINITLADGFTPQLGETYFLFAGTDNTMNNLDLSSFQTVSPDLPAGMFWSYSIESLTNGGLALAASMGVPEPATWILLAFGAFFMLLRGVHVRRAAR